MELNEFKSGWQNAGGPPKSELELKKMTKLVNHPVIKKIRTKLVIQFTGLLLFVVFYYDWFDGNQKPLYANVALLTGLMLYLLNDMIGYKLLTKPVGEADLTRSVSCYLAKVKRLSFFSIIVTLLYSTSLLVFFISTIRFTKEKWLVLMFSIVIVFQLVLLSSKLWSRWIKKLERQVADFNMNEHDIHQQTDI